MIRKNYRPERDDWKIDLAMGDCELELFIMKGHPERPSPEAYGLRHLAFRVESVDETVAELAEKGIECEPRPRKLHIHSLPFVLTSSGSTRFPEASGKLAPFTVRPPSEKTHYVNRTSKNGQ